MTSLGFLHSSSRELSQAVYNPFPMTRHERLLGALAGMVLAATASAQVQSELLARSRVFSEVGPGVRALRRDAARRHYVLASPRTLLVYNAAGQRLRQIPPAPSKANALAYGDDLDVACRDPAAESDCLLYVADRGANNVKVLHSDGTLAQTITIPAPTSVVSLSDGEIAVASMKTAKLVTLFDAHGKVTREFGDPAEAAQRGELNRFLNIGRLATDSASHIYYAFSYLPEPTVRKYDRFGYAAMELELATLEFLPMAQAARREILRQERGGTPSLRPIVTAIDVDQETQEIWVALGGLLLHFDRDGGPRGSYRTYTPDGARLQATAILVEPNRLLLAADPLGVFEFARPDKTQH